MPVTRETITATAMVRKMNSKGQTGLRATPGVVDVVEGEVMLAVEAEVAEQHRLAVQLLIGTQTPLRVAGKTLLTRQADPLLLEPANQREQEAQEEVHDTHTWLRAGACVLMGPSQTASASR